MATSIANRPRVRLLALDSTLASTAGDPLKLSRYGRSVGRPQMTPAEILESLPEVQHAASVEPGPHVHIADPDSAIPAEPTWGEFARRLECSLTAGEDAGAVVIHGTDRLEEIAYFLNLTVHAERPIVVVGAQRPWDVLSSDGPLNVVNAVRVAADPGAARRGVLVLLNDTIHAARDVTKTKTYRLETFQSCDVGPLGYADPDRIVFYRRPERTHTMRSELAAPPDGRFPRVDILYGYGADASLAEAAVALGADGLVIASAGAGSLAGMKPALMSMVSRGIAVVRSSRVGGGRVLVDSNGGGPGLIAADNLNPQKARILLMLALLKTRDPVTLQRFYDEY